MRRNVAKIGKREGKERERERVCCSSQKRNLDDTLCINLSMTLSLPCSGWNFMETELDMITGIGKIDDMSFMFVGHQKGRNTKENIHRNFAMPTPNGYNKSFTFEILLSCI